MTQDLDQKWKEMAGGLRNSGTIYSKKEEVDNDEETDEYNKLMKELVFEPKKAKAQDRLKTDEEIVKETKERLELLEQLRVQRMKGDTEQDDEEEMEEDKAEENEDENGEESDNDNEEDENDNDEDENENDNDEDDDDKDEYSDLEESEDEREPVTTPQSKSKQKQQ